MENGDIPYYTDPSFTRVQYSTKREKKHRSREKEQWSIYLKHYTAMEAKTRDKINNIVCWIVIAGAAIYFTVRILIGIAAKYHMLFA